MIPRHAGPTWGARPQPRPAVRGRAVAALDSAIARASVIGWAKGAAASLALWAAATLGTMALAPMPAVAHELEGHRLTLVQREGGLLSLGFHLDALRLLQRTLSPGEPAAQVLATQAALPPDEFARGWQRMREAVEQHTRLRPSGGAPQAPTRWQWPAPAQVQALLQQRLMQSLATPGAHGHAPVIEVQAQLALRGASPPVTQVELLVPAALRPLVVVSYRPRQAWVGEAASSAMIDMR